MKEASTGDVTLEDDDPGAIESMLQFCYGINYMEKNPKYMKNDPESESLHSKLHTSTPQGHDDAMMNVLRYRETLPVRRASR